MSYQHLNMATLFTTSFTKIWSGVDWTAGMRTDEFCSSVARDEADASLWCSFSLCFCLLRLWNLKHFWKNVFYCFSLFFFFVNDAVIIKHLTGVNFNICRWFWSLCFCVFLWDHKLGMCTYCNTLMYLSCILFEYFKFMPLYDSIPIHLRGKSCTLHCTTFISKLR